ncbi:hypothetical protein [Paradesulfitobacterium ferrireducens]|uniref:hypothetical protein n=1 Tax=Paradesulfitobacterium ferrireducens TaxID=2816476 RepID=UPI001A905B3C|nr:hypothetical protein [Paradesulfitobacterium ferrireducens]
MNARVGLLADQILGLMDMNHGRFKMILQLTYQLRDDGLSDNDIQKFQLILQERNNLIQEINQDNSKVNDLQNEICQLLGLPSFELEDLKPYITKETVMKFEFINKAIEEAIEKILVFDNTYIHLIRTEMDSILEVQRQVRRSKNIESIYRSNYSPLEAKFIDKKR